MMNWEPAPFTALFNFTHSPAATVPAGFASNGVPVGMQMVGRLRNEATLLRLAAAIEEARPWAQKQPEL
jgi:aspartyl-tRNA(Asn)/glutamyl-tRNA(Gln) amidotransferase subunit A